MNANPVAGPIGSSSSGGTGRRRGFFLRLCTANPFYAISAVLVFVGLRSTFNTTAAHFPSWALMAGLGGYTLLLASMAVLLVRFGNVWDDIRTLLLLIVLMFLVISVAFDEILTRDMVQGVACCWGGLAFAVLLSEGLLRSIRLALPAWYRVPYYLFLGLFFLYPVAMTPLLRRPTDPALLWALFGFPVAAGLLALTLIPAIRRGPGYVRANGSPWPWPFYPWSLFFFLGFGVCARTYYLCLSAQYSSYTDQYDSLLSSIFGPYFLVPFLLGVSALVLEMAVGSRSSLFRNLALLAPAGLVVLAMVGHQPDPIYRKFLEMFESTLGGRPAYLTLLVLGAFYAIAALRRIPHAWDGITAILIALAYVGPHTMTLDRLALAHPAPLLVVAGLQLILAIRSRSSGRALLASIALTTASSLTGTAWSPLVRSALVFHLAVGSMMVIGLAFDDVLGKFLRGLGAVLLLAAGQMALLLTPGRGDSITPDLIRVYPLALCAVAAAYGWLAHSRAYYAVAGLSLFGAVAVVGWHGYGRVRRLVAGLDQIALGLVSFGLAAFISFWKAGAFRRRGERWRETLAGSVSKPYPADGLGEPT